MNYSISLHMLTLDIVSIVEYCTKHANPWNNEAVCMPNVNLIKLGFELYFASLLSIGQHAPCDHKQLPVSDASVQVRVQVLHQALFNGTNHSSAPGSTGPQW